MPLSTILIALALFIACYAIVIVTTSVGYHRGLAHGAVTIRAPFKRLLLTTGIWVTAVDPKTWVVMHRLHHAHSDTSADPHSPKNAAKWGGAVGRFLGMFAQQLISYGRVAEGLRNNDERYTSVGRDLGELSWAMRVVWRGWVPVVLHVAIAVGLGYATGAWLIGVAWFTGMMSHVVQGAIINYFGHAHGSRNFPMDDDSRNNHIASWLALGEGYQNNHHRHPMSARFSFRPAEVDLGYPVCLFLERIRVLDVQRRSLMPRFG